VESLNAYFGPMVDAILARGGIADKYIGDAIMAFFGEPVKRPDDALQAVLCAFDMLDALGTGKSSHKTLGPVAQKIRANPRVPIKVVIGADDICAPCEWWDHEKSLCKKSLDKYPQDNQNSLTSDKNAIRVLGLKPGDVMKADDLYRLIKAKVTKKVFAEEVCVACRLVDTCKETCEPKIEAAVKALSEPPR